MSALFSQEYLSKCAALGRVRPQVEFGPGDFIARGFADLGAEVFCIIGADKMVSVFSGHISDAPRAADGHFFRVYDPDSLVNELLKLGAAIEGCRFLDQRTWLIQVSMGERKIEKKADSLHGALIDCLIQAAEIST